MGLAEAVSTATETAARVAEAAEALGAAAIEWLEASDGDPDHDRLYRSVDALDRAARAYRAVILGDDS